MSSANTSASANAEHTTFHDNGEIHTICNKIQGQYNGVMAIYGDDGTYAGYRIYMYGDRMDSRTHTYFDDDGSVFVSIKKVHNNGKIMVDGA